MTSTILNYEGEHHAGAEGFWAHGEVTPLRDDQQRRSTDATKLTFPLPLMAAIVGGLITIALTVSGAFWIATSTLRSDVRDILTRMEMQARTEAEKSETQKMRDASLRDQMSVLSTQISAAERRQELLRLEFQQLREQVLFKTKGVR